MKKKIIFIIILTLFTFFCYFLLNDNDNNNSKSKQELIINEEKTDKEKPIIKLLGQEEITMVINSEYEEKGAIATDNIDGDITKNIKIKDNIDTSKSGDYIVNYSVKDSSNNKETITRKVRVIDVDEPDTDGISVLMYHYFYDDTSGQTGQNSNYLAKSKFEEQLKYLKDNNYYFPTMKEISMYLDGKIKLPEKSVVITMDDGDESNYSIAYNLAINYKIPMTMFVVTSWTNVNNEVQQQMINSGYISMQSHSHDMHKAGCSGQGHGGIMLCIDYDTGVADLKQSKELIGNGDSFAYPYGDYNDHTVKMLFDAGFTLAFTTNYGKVKIGQNKLALPRVRINSGISLESFKSSL